VVIFAVQISCRPPFRRSHFPDLILFVVSNFTVVLSLLGEAMRRRDFIKVIAGSTAAWLAARRARTESGEGAPDIFSVHTTTTAVINSRKIVACGLADTAVQA
jgi:hypothetical protein